MVVIQLLQPSNQQAASLARQKIISVDVVTAHASPEEEEEQS